MQNITLGPPQRKQGKKAKARYTSHPATSGVKITKEMPFDTAPPDMVRLTRWVVSNVYPQTAAVPTSFAFHLNLLPSYSEITAMYDQYRIDQIDIIYEPASRCGPSAATTSNGAPHMLTRVDYDNSAALTYDQLRECSNTMVHSVFERWEHSFKPRVSPEVYNGVASTGYMVASGDPWISTGSPSVPLTINDFV